MGIERSRHQLDPGTVPGKVLFKEGQGTNGQRSGKCSGTDLSSCENETVEQYVSEMSSSWTAVGAGGIRHGLDTASQSDTLIPGFSRGASGGLDTVHSADINAGNVRTLGWVAAMSDMSHESHMQSQLQYDIQRHA